MPLWPPLGFFPFHEGFHFLWLFPSEMTVHFGWGLLFFVHFGTHAVHVYMYGARLAYVSDHG